MADRKPTKKAPAKKAAAREKAAPRARAHLAPGKHGPAPLVVRGFTYTPPASIDEEGAAVWTPKSPAGRLLAALAIGATWEHAADYAHLHEATGRTWNDRGKKAIGEHPSLDEYAATDPTPEDLAYAAFAVAAAEARTSPVVGALDEIDRARRRGDIKAAAMQLKHLPQAGPYRETTRTEVTGANGGPVDIDVRADAIREALEGFKAEGEPPAEV